MPNWVHNGLSIDGNKEDIAKLKAQMNQPFTRTHDQWNSETNQSETKEITFSNPVGGIGGRTPYEKLLEVTKA